MSRKGLPAMPLWVDRFFGSPAVAELGGIEQGLYLLVLARMWQAGEHGLTANRHRLCRILSLDGRAARRYLCPVLELFEERDGVLYHPVLNAEFMRAAERSESARKSAGARWNSDANASRSEMRTQCERNALHPHPHPDDPPPIVPPPPSGGSPAAGSGEAGGSPAGAEPVAVTPDDGDPLGADAPSAPVCPLPEPRGGSRSSSPEAEPPEDLERLEAEWRHWVAGWNREAARLGFRTVKPPERASGASHRWIAGREALGRIPPEERRGLYEGLLEVLPGRAEEIRELVGGSRFSLLGLLERPERLEALVRRAQVLPWDPPEATEDEAREEALRRRSEELRRKIAEDEAAAASADEARAILEAAPWRRRKEVAS